MPLLGRVPVVLRIVDGLGQLLDRGVGRGQVRVPEAEVDDVTTGSTGLELQRLDVREDVRGQAVDPSELHRERLVPVPSLARLDGPMRSAAHGGGSASTPRATRAMRTPPRSPRRRPPLPATARSRGPRRPRDRPTSPRSAGPRTPATAAGWPSHRLDRTRAPRPTRPWSSILPHPHRAPRHRGRAGATRAARPVARPGGSKGIPKARFSAALMSPVPSPAMSRPGAMPATTGTRPPGSRRARARCVPRAGRSRPGAVDAANAPSTGKADSAGRCGSPIGHRWSKTKTPSRPSSSARRAARDGDRVVAKRRKRDPDPHGAQSTSSGHVDPVAVAARATSAAPMAPARSPSSAGTIFTSGR